MIIDMVIDMSIVMIIDRIIDIDMIIVMTHCWFQGFCFAFSLACFSLFRYGF
jgi:hypothetical protein